MNWDKNTIFQPTSGRLPLLVESYTLVLCTNIHNIRIIHNSHSFPHSCKEMSLKENLKVFAEKLESAKIKYAQISKRYSY